MKYLFKCLFLSLCVILGSVGLLSCSDEPDDPNSTGNSYGSLNGNLIATGDANRITYTSGVVLGTVDFNKLSGNHSYGIVYVPDKGLNYDYATYLTCANVPAKQQLKVTSSSATGEFEKQISGLMPATRYYYRAWIAVGNNYSYSSVASFRTNDPSPELRMTTDEPTNITAVGATMQGTVNMGQLQKVVAEQAQGFILSTTLDSPETLTYEYYWQWKNNHLETDAQIAMPTEYVVTENLDNNIRQTCFDLVPDVTYYYRSFFKWNEKYFYSPDVKSFKTEGKGTIALMTQGATDITYTSATLHALIPYSKIGVPNVTVGFVYSDTYSIASELTISNSNVKCKCETVTGDVVASTLTGLQPNTTYYYRAFIQIPVGNHDLIYIYDDNEVKSFKTEEINVTTGDATNIVGTYARLNGIMPYNGLSTYQRGGFIYSANYSELSDLTLQNAETKNDIFIVDVNQQTDNYSCPVSGLTPTTTYYYRAYVNLKFSGSNEVLTIYAKDIKSFTTAASDPRATIALSSKNSYWSQKADGWWESTNKGIRNSHAIIVFSVTHNEGDCIELDWYVDSEEKDDYLSCTMSTVGYLSLVSGRNKSGRAKHVFSTTGTTLLTCRYDKGTNGNVGGDYARFKFVE